MKLITGANRGIGAALLGALDGAKGTARSPQGDLLPLDVTDQGSCDALASRLADTPLSLLVCNAGIYPDKDRDSWDLDNRIWQQIFATNVTGVYQTIRALRPNLIAGRGKVAIISSIMGSSEHAKGTSIAYRVSKAAVTNLGLNMATALRPDGVAVGIYHPGWVRTEMGGGEADISADVAVQGLCSRFEELSLESTGCFLSYDGNPIAV